MRDIKFRAWDLKNKYMFSNDNEELLLNIDGSSLWGHKIHYYDGTDLLEIDDFEIMQYTGLKDSNGVEIYEGDIIRGMDMLSARTGGRADDREMVGQVVIDSSSVWGFSIVVYETEYHLNDFLEKDQEAEVIGNIYENPELLEG